MVLNAPVLNFWPKSFGSVFYVLELQMLQLPAETTLYRHTGAHLAQFGDIALNEWVGIVGEVWKVGEYFVSGREINREEERMFAKNGTKLEVFSETFDNFFPRMFNAS